MNVRISMILAAVVLGAFAEYEDEECKCRQQDNCWPWETNVGNCETSNGYTGMKCCKTKPSCECKSYCDSNERRATGCGDSGQDAYCCRTDI